MPTRGCKQRGSNLWRKQMNQVDYEHVSSLFNIPPQIPDECEIPFIKADPLLLTTADIEDLLTLDNGE
jgi:hypothetical protein